MSNYVEKKKYPDQDKLGLLINHYSKTRVAHSWINTRDESDHSRIRRNLKRAREHLEEYILSEFGVEVHLD